MTPALAFASLLRPQVIDWGRLPLGSAPADPGGRTPRVALAFPLLFRGTVIDWGWTPRGAIEEADTAGTRHMRQMRAATRRRRKC